MPKTNKQVAELLRSAASALEHGRYATYNKKLAQVAANGRNPAESGLQPKAEAQCQMCGHPALGTKHDAGSGRSIAVCARCKSGNEELAKEQGRMPYELYGEFLDGVAKDNAREERIRELAREQHQVDGEVEIDDVIGGAEISEGDDNGAYVRAWVWVDFSDTDLDKEDEEEGDDLCDLCMSSGVTVERTTPCGKTIGVGCGCDETHAEGTCNDTDCEQCKALAPIAKRRAEAEKALIERLQKEGREK